MPQQSDGNLRTRCLTAGSAWPSGWPC